MNVIVPPAPISSNSSSKPSPLLNLQMEPPSNQNYNYTQALPRVEKAVNMKRTHPFSLEDPPPVALSHKITHHIDLTDESTSHGGGIMFRNEYPDGLSISGSRYTPESNSKKGLRDHSILREVLTLAPPSTPSTWMNSKPVDSLPLHHEPRHLDQGHLEELGIFQQGSIKVGQQHILHYSFLPPSIPHLTLAGSESKYGNGEDQELIDLELRL
ncbi:hypothetical protein SAY86_016529 [Trapa natans]|uniref:Uncharacterized protein n=1 Tax=Trapa natans TaxID=22666 RepID=A0AAN7L9P0_TRANT|nr:hypothetical protein SAY86_016529 [Trapa natans]